MPTEIRPVSRAEVGECLKVLPFANGLPHWEPAPAAWHAGEGPWPPAARAAVGTRDRRLRGRDDVERLPLAKAP